MLKDTQSNKKCKIPRKKQDKRKDTRKNVKKYPETTEFGRTIS